MSYHFAPAQLMWEMLGTDKGFQEIICIFFFFVFLLLCLFGELHHSVFLAFWGLVRAQHISWTPRVWATGRGFYWIPEIIIHQELIQTENLELETCIGCSLLCRFWRAWAMTIPSWGLYMHRMQSRAHTIAQLKNHYMEPDHMLYTTRALNLTRHLWHFLQLVSISHVLSS